MSTSKNILVYALVAALAAVAGLLVATQIGQPRKPEQALVYETARALPEFSLLDHRGQPFGPESLDGSWTLMFFGFTHCPDICPTTLQSMTTAAKKLADLPEASRPSVVMVSIDPVRDTVTALAEYVPYFNPDFVGVTGDMNEIQSLTRAIGVAYAYTPGPDSEGYTVEHTASIFLLNPDGELVAVFGTPHTVEGLVRDYRIIVGNQE
ncbi:MAG: SCO family protein [Gammaproteobacteria bacterium]